jgi:hypothetical protein
MGGLALKHLNVQRIPADQYNELSGKVQRRFTSLFGQRPDVIPAYSQKPDFGDCDMLITSSELPELWRENLATSTKSRGWLKNGDVTSMEIENVQFDFIHVPRHYRQFAFTYFAYNDLGNLMGRVAHQMGFKYGHLGFQKVLRDGDHAYATINTTYNIEEVFHFLGYDHQRWLKGFRSLEEIFEFTASSKYFNPNIYLLHNRDSPSRVRDAKRKTYTEFLIWCEQTSGLNCYPWPIEAGQRLKDEAFHLARADERWPLFAHQAQVEIDLQAARVDLKARWNGHNVKLWTGLEGKALGDFMVQAKGHPEFEEASWGLDTLETLVREIFLESTSCL